MSAEEIAEQFAGDRDGFLLVDYAEVGLPFWRVRARCEVQDTKRISLIDETILRAVGLGIADPIELQGLLGLDEPLVETSIMAARGEQWLTRGDGRLSLTDTGRRVLSAAREIVSREQVIPFLYDGLLRRAIPSDVALAPRALADRGAREVPPYPARKPDLPELRSASADIERVLRAYGRQQDQEAHLLAIKSLDGRERVFRPAIALVFRARDSRDVEIAFAVDGTLSLDHERAFAQAGLAERLGLDRALRRGQLDDPAQALPASLRERYDASRDDELRSRLREAQRAVSREVADREEQLRLEADLKVARDELVSLPIRRVETYEHPRFLRIALGTSKKRLLVVSPWINDKVVDSEFLRRLEDRLKSGTNVLLGYGIGNDPADDVGDQASKGLRRLDAKYRNFRFAHLGGGTHAKVLISDSAFGIITSFNWLSFQGDPTRTFRDERGVVFSSTPDIDDEWETWEAKFPDE